MRQAVLAYETNFRCKYAQRDGRPHRGERPTERTSFAFVLEIVERQVRNASPTIDGVLDIFCLWLALSAQPRRAPAMSALRPKVMPIPSGRKPLFADNLPIKQLFTIAVLFGRIKFIRAKSRW